MHAPTEVGQLDRAEAIEKVLWLDVPMDDVLLVDVLERLDHLPDVVRSFLLRVLLLCFQVFVEFTLGAVLENQVDLIFVEEEAVELNNVRVSQMTLDLDLSPQLVLNAAFEKLLLEEHFEGDDVLAALLTGEVHVAKLATAEGLADFEIVD